MNQRLKTIIGTTHYEPSRLSSFGKTDDMYRPKSEEH